MGALEERGTKKGLRVTEKQKQVFVRAVASGKTNRQAAEIAGFEHRTIYRIRDKDRVFAEAYELAKEEAADIVREEVMRRGVHGFDEETRDGEGRLIRTVRRFSDQALLAEAKRRDPAYRDNQKLELSGTAHVEVKHSVDPTVVLERLAAAGVIQLGPAEPGDPQAVVDAGRRALLPARTD